jgi:sigma-B regulation protein RsbU (phosphoserine phosphatase)
VLQMKNSPVKAFPAERLRSERIAQVIFEHAARISRQTDVPAMANLNADLARDLLGADRCSLWLVDQKSGELYTRVAHGIKEIRIQKGVGIVGASVSRGEPIIVNDVKKERRFFAQVDGASGYETQCVISVPLWVEGEIIGAIQALNKMGGFSHEDAELLRFMGMYAAAAIHAERLRQEAEAVLVLQRELDVAAEVQRRLLPQQAIQPPGLEVAALCRPARIVGGDFFDLLDLSQGRFGFTLGDVSGKGFPAAVAMASIHMLLRRLILHSPENPAQVITELNEAFYESSTADRYSTLVCGTLNAARNELLYVNAGHVQPMIVRGCDGRVDCLSGGDLPVGLLPGVRYSQHRQAISRGDIIAFISDGIAEAQNPQGELWEPSQVTQILSNKRDLPAEQLVKGLVSAVDDYASSSEQFDDMTVVLIRVRP